MKRITILGSTGSIGRSSLAVINQHPEDFCILALTAYNDVNLLFAQCVQYRPQYAVLVDRQRAAELSNRLSSTSLDNIKILSGVEGLNYVASLASVDIVIAAIVGAAGLLPTLSAVQAGKRVLLANKEVLIMGGQFFMDEVKKSNAILLSIDSEHNAVSQCLASNAKTKQGKSAIKKITITASGGAVRNKPLNELYRVKPEEACCNPNWNMGKKISVDSSTMMNKGFELIEAHWLFNLSISKIEVLLHPQSIVHALVEYIDNSVLAHMSNPDMQLPISYALAWPKRIINNTCRLNLLEIGQLDFFPLDLQRYPCFSLAVEALKLGGTAPTILNATNEIAVQAFLEGKIAFTDIARLNAMVLEKNSSHTTLSLKVILEDDFEARQTAVHFLKHLMNIRCNSISSSNKLIYKKARLEHY